MNDTVRMALDDAIAWQQWLLRCHSHFPDDEPEVVAIKARIAAYQKLLKRYARKEQR